MFGIGLPEMILILALALIVVGPDKLPELARSVAKGVLELKKTVSSLKDNLAEENPFDSVKPELEEAARSLKEKLGDPVVEEWKGILPDGGVNPLSTDGDDTIVEEERLSDEDKETLDAMDLAQEEGDTDTEEPPRTQETESAEDSVSHSKGQTPGQGTSSSPT